MQRKQIPFVLAALLLAPVAAAQKLAVGDAAPALHIAKWVKGAAVESFTPGKVYVVEFWATWCGPCVASMPHLSQLQAQFKDKGVTIVGVTTADPNNSLEQVEAMVKDKGDGMGYTVAFDDGKQTFNAYMQAAGQGGIPCAFLIDGKGKLAYIGHPIVLDIPLPEVVAGTWDASKGEERIKGAMKQQREAIAAVVADPEQGKKKLDAFVAAFPMLAHGIDETVFHQLVAAGKFERAWKVGDRVVDEAIAAKNPMTLNDVAWAIVDPEAKIEPRNLELALRAATAAVELSKQRDGAIIDTLARVWFWKQDYKKALELQQKAVEVDKRDDLRKTLEEYEKLATKGTPQDAGSKK